MFDPREYLELAKQVRSLPRSEGNDRAAIGRAYYAAFLVTREYIERSRVVAHPPVGKRWGSHETVIFTVGAIRAPGVRGVQKRLFRLKKLRTLADYDLHYAHAERDAGRALRDAERVIDWIDGLP
jgi:hypothetical protein